MFLYIITFIFVSGKYLQLFSKGTQLQVGLPGASPTSSSIEIFPSSVSITVERVEFDTPMYISID